MGKITILRLVDPKGKPKSWNKGVEKKELDVLLPSQSFPEEEASAPPNKIQLYSVTSHSDISSRRPARHGTSEEPTE